MSGTVTLYPTTKESVQVEIRTPSDPGVTPPEFALSAVGASSPGTFGTGSWSGSWDSATGKRLAISPTLGPSGTAALAIETGDSYALWARVTLSNEVAVWVVATIVVK